MRIDDLEFYDTTEAAPDLGVQGDGEPAKVTAQEQVEEPAEEPTPDTDSEDEVEEEEKPKKKSGSQRWKEKAHREAEEKEYWRQLALKNQQPEANKTEVPSDKPAPERFDTHEAYLEALVDWKADQKVKAQEAERRQEAWSTKAQEARSKFDDFDDALQSAPAPSPSVSEVLFESPKGAELAYYLATHEDEYKRINKLSPVAAARELGLIEGRISAEKKEAKAAPVSKAPRPVAPVNPASSAPSKPERHQFY